jgi:hypothetical protein
VIGAACNALPQHNCVMCDTFIRSNFNGMLLEVTCRSLAVPNHLLE